MTYILDDIEIDIINYNGVRDFQVLTEYVSEEICKIIVYRLDTTNVNNGWDEDINVLMCNSKGISRVINIGNSGNAKKEIEINAGVFIKFVCSSIKIEDIKYDMYNGLPEYNIKCINRLEFNKLFDTDIVCLPSNIYAVGIKDGMSVYKYNDSYNKYEWSYEIGLTISHIVSVALSKKDKPLNFYFLICAHDGYFEGHYPSYRSIGKKVSERKYENVMMIKEEEENVYPILHKYHYVLGQNVKSDMYYTIAMPDRYYFCLNRYNLYRSIHKGINYESKKSKIVYAGNERGSKFNFITRKDINKSQREYFKEFAIGKEYIETGNIDRNEMINYKYILDIDGNASTWDATAWKLNSGSVILKTESSWVQWFFDKYKPWVHYIPIKEDFEDIENKYKWCEENVEECKKIVKNSKKLFQEVYRYTNVMKYTNSIIEIISKNEMPYV